MEVFSAAIYLHVKFEPNPLTSPKWSTTVQPVAIYLLSAMNVIIKLIMMCYFHVKFKANLYLYKPLTSPKL